ncbi:hypothetical protein RFI_40022, partial [Reticulomyxa filosa]
KEAPPLLIEVGLDTVWGPNANDGIFDGQTLFQTKMGRDDSQCFKCCRPSPFFKEEKEKEDHVLSHSSEEGGGGFITLADVKQKLGQTSDTIATRIAETSTLLMRGRTGKVKYIDPCERRILKLLVFLLAHILQSAPISSWANLQDLTKAFEFNYPHRRKSKMDDVVRRVNRARC